MPVLRNPRHEKFSQLVASGIKPTEAYVSHRGCPDTPNGTRSPIASTRSEALIHAADQRCHHSLGLFLLPGGLPLRFTSVIHFGGLPRRLPRPRARRSKTMMPSSICCRSLRSSSSILLMSISEVYQR